MTVMLAEFFACLFSAGSMSVVDDADADDCSNHSSSTGVDKN